MAWFARGNRTQQTPGVLVFRIGQDPLGGPGFHHASVLHDGNGVSDPGYCRQIVADHQHRRTLPAQLAQQVEHLRGNRCIKCRGGFIGNDKSRVKRNGRGNQCTLAHTPGKFAG